MVSSSVLYEVYLTYYIMERLARNLLLTQVIFTSLVEMRLYECPRATILYDHMQYLAKLVTKKLRGLQSPGM